MGKLPAFLFYPGDWVQDTSHLSLEERGAWIDILCALWRAKERGTLTLNVEGWARVIRENSDTFLRVYKQFTKSEICDSVTTSNGDVTITNRRMVREQRERENTRLRMIRYRGKRNKNEKVTSVSSVAVAVSSSNTTKTDTTTTPSGVVDKAKKEPADLMVTELQKMFAGKLKEVTGSGAGFSWGQSGAMFKRLLKLEDITSIQSAIDNWFCSKDEFIKNNLTHLGVFEKKFYVLKKGAIDGYGKSNQKIIGYHN